MYKNLKIYIPDSRDPAIQKKEFIEYFQKEFFDSRTVYSISKALQDKGVISEKYAIYRQCAELNVTDIQKTLANKVRTFKNDYSRMTYILGLLKNHVSEDIATKKPNQQQELGQSDPIAEDTLTPVPPPKAEDRLSWMDELMADSQPPTEASAEDKPAISDSDLFETAPDAIHEAWAKLDESERRKNWDKAIAVHQQQHPPKAYVYDEMY